MIEKPFFLIGSERSGSTLLRLMLDHHPQIACNLESDFLVSQLPEEAGWPEMNAYRQWLAEDRVFQHSRFKINRELDYRGLVNDLLLQKQQSGNKLVVGATVHRNFDRLPRIWPNAKYIYLLRDGRDVSRSVIQMGWASNLWVAADVWLEAEMAWDVMRPKLRGDQWIETRYEDLVAEPTIELKRICDFLGVEYSNQMFDYSDKSTYDRPDPKLIFQWKRTLSRPELQIVEARLADRLRKRGYELSGLPIPDVSRQMDRKLRWQSRIATYKRRIETFGLSLIVQETVARRMGITTWRRRCQERIDQIINANLR